MTKEATRGGTYPVIRERVMTGARVVTTADVVSVVRDVRGAAPNQTVNETIRNLVDEGLLGKVRRGLFENLTVRPRVDPAELTHHLRTGSVVSLLTVVGERVGNNSPGYVWAVLPHEGIGTAKASSGQVEFPVQGRREPLKYEFRTMEAKVFHAPARDDLYDPRFAYPRATAEAALAHWLYLATEERRLRIGTKKPIARPPITDMDFTEVDEDRLWRVAEAMSIPDALEAWLRNRPEEDHGDDQYSAGLGF